MGKNFKRNRKGYINLKNNFLPESPPDSPVKKSSHSKSPACKTPQRKSPFAADAARPLSPSKKGGDAIPFPSLD